MNNPSKQSTSLLNNRFLDLLSSCPKEVDLGNETLDPLIYQTSDAILKEGYSIEEILSLKEALIADSETSHLFMLLCLKLAKSKLLAQQNHQPLFVSVLFAMYKEHLRIQPRKVHPHGENFLLRKVKQLEWLFKSLPHISWELVAVDDGCPENSGSIAEKLIEQHGLVDQARVLYLTKAIEQKLPPVRSIGSAKESQKGGSIIYGMWDAVKRAENKNQVVLYTDADLSTHLGQVMLLIDPLLKGDKMAAIGSRREAQSVVMKRGMRNERGKLFIYLWKRLIPILKDIVDTQCGFKAFKAEIIPHITEDLIEKKFAFDIELLVRTELLHPGSIEKVPIAWIDSEAASTTKDLQPYLPMLKAIVKMNQKYFSQGANEFADFIESLEQDRFLQLLSNIPEEITSREPDVFSTFDELKVRDFPVE